MEHHTQQEQAEPRVRERIRAGFARQGPMGHLGARVGHHAALALFDESGNHDMTPLTSAIDSEVAA